MLLFLMLLFTVIVTAWHWFLTNHHYYNWHKMVIQMKLLNLYSIQTPPAVKGIVFYIIKIICFIEA